MQPRTLPALMGLVMLGGLLGLGWLATGPATTEAGQPCYRGWLLVGVLGADRDPRPALLHGGGLPIGAPRETRIYVVPTAARTSPVQDLRRLDYPVWAPGQDSAALAGMLQAEGLSAQVQPLCGGLGPIELAVPLGLVMLGPALALVLAAEVARRRRRSRVSDAST